MNKLLAVLIVTAFAAGAYAADAKNDQKAEAKAPATAASGAASAPAMKARRGQTRRHEERRSQEVVRRHPSDARFVPGVFLASIIRASQLHLPCVTLPCVELPCVATPSPSSLSWLRLRAGAGARRRTAEAAGDHAQRRHPQHPRRGRAHARAARRSA